MGMIQMQCIQKTFAYNYDFYFNGRNQLLICEYDWCETAGNMNEKKITLERNAC